MVVGRRSESLVPALSPRRCSGLPEQRRREPAKRVEGLVTVGSWLEPGAWSLEPLGNYFGCCIASHSMAFCASEPTNTLSGYRR